METELTNDQATAVARQLADAAQHCTPVEVLGVEPGTLEDAYRIQEAGHVLHGDDALIAWKVGSTSDASQRFLGVDAPVAGRYRSMHVLSDPARLDVAEFATHPQLEVEIGFRLLTDLDAAPLDPMQLVDAVEVFAAMEVVAGRLASFPMVGAPALIADNVAGGRMIVGPTLDLSVDQIRKLDTTMLALSIEGEEVATGSGSDALGHPLVVLSWLAGHAASRGTPLRAGDLVITGTCTGLVPARRGASHVGRVGGVDVNLVVV